MVPGQVLRVGGDRAVGRVYRRQGAAHGRGCAARRRSTYPPSLPPPRLRATDTASRAPRPSWPASSLVGATTKTAGRAGPAVRPLFCSRSNAHDSTNPRATVLPEPVWDAIRRSRPTSSGLRTAAWIGVRAVKASGAQRASEPKRCFFNGCRHGKRGDVALVGPDALGERTELLCCRGPRGPLDTPALQRRCAAAVDKGGDSEGSRTPKGCFVEDR